VAVDLRPDHLDRQPALHDPEPGAVRVAHPVHRPRLLTALIALVSYTILILVRNIVAGLDGVPAAVREAADGMGYTRVRRLWAVELPLALPTMIAGSGSPRSR
jgi:osmoprotectant transport system permease protein